MATQVQAEAMSIMHQKLGRAIDSLMPDQPKLAIDKRVDAAFRRGLHVGARAAVERVLELHFMPPTLSRQDELSLNALLEVMREPE